VTLPSGSRRPRRTGRLIVLGLGVGVLLSGFEWAGRSQRLARELEAASPERRREIVRLLAQSDPAAVRAPLLRALDDPDLEVRAAAALAAGRLGLREALPTLVDWLDDADPALRAAAAEGLGALGDERGRTGLVRALGDVSPDVRLAAVRALPALSDKAVLVPLLGRLDDTDVGVRMAAVEALAALGQREAVVPLVGRARDDVAEVRAVVVDALGTLGDVRALPALRRALEDASEEVQVAAVGALGRLGDAAAVDTLAALLADGSRRLAEAAVAALAGIDDPSTLPPLLAALDRAALAPALVHAIDGRVRRARRRGDGAETALIARLGQALAREERPSQATALARLLARQATPGDRAAVEPALLAAQRAEAADPNALLAALARIGSPEAVIPLLDRLGDAESPGELSPILDALATYAEVGPVDGRMVDPLLDALARVPAVDRPRLVQLLADTGASRATPALLPLLTHPDRPLRLAAVEAVGTLGGEGAGDALVSLLDDRDPEVRLAAATALGRAGDGAMVDPLLRLLHRASPTDRHAVLLALGGIAGGGGLADGAPARARLLDGLRAAAAHPDRGLAARARDALARWGSAEARASLRERAADPTGSISARREAMLALAGARDPEALPLAREALGPATPRSVRLAAAVLLGEVGASGDLDALLTVLREAPWPLSAAASFAVARWARRQGTLPPAAREMLCRAVRGPGSPMVRGNAAVALAATEGPPCPERRPPPEALADLRQSPVERAALARWVGARARAASAAGEGGDPGVAESAAAWLTRCAREDRDGTVRAACEDPTLPLLEAELDVYAVSADGRRVLRDQLVAVRLADDSILPVPTDANGHLRLQGVPAGAVRLADPFDIAAAGD